MLISLYLLFLYKNHEYTNFALNISKILIKLFLRLILAIIAQLYSDFL